MPDTENTSLSDSTEPTAEQVEAAARRLAELDLSDDQTPWHKYKWEASTILRAALSVAPSAPTEDDREALAHILDHEGAQTGECGHEPGDMDTCENGCRELMYEYADAILAAGFRRSPVAPSEDVAKLIEGLEFAMLGTEDGGLLDPTDDSIPVGEMFRLASEYLAAVLRSGASVPVEPGEEFVIEAEASLDEDGLSHLPRRIGPFASREAAEVWLDARRPLWGSYEIAPLFRPTREEER